jgi:hypothetical protein
MFVVAYLSIQPLANLFSSKQLMNFSFDTLHLVNTYGSFASVTKERLEVVIEGTDEETLGSDTIWKEYQFKIKPGDPSRRHPIVSPYHYHLDWQMWFAALSTYHYQPWLLSFIEKLLENDKSACSLLEFNPFEEQGPRHIRALLYHYRFATREEQSKSGLRWIRSLKGEYFPPVGNTVQNINGNGL